MALTIPHSTGHYEVITGPLAGLPDALARAGLLPAPSLVVADATVAALHGDTVMATLAGAGFAPHLLRFPAGEASKSLPCLAGLYDAALARSPGRHTPVVALGGGVAGDLAGFLAATLLRGLPLVHLPTSLLAMVDSSLGGKTGVNHAAGKNLIGSVYPPRLVLADPAFLDTLPDREFASGLAEAVKHALILDAAFVDWWEGHLSAVLARAPEATATAVFRAQSIKAEVVAADEFEQGERALLNFGHTFGHAFEAVAGYGTLLHGEAILYGMEAALALSATRTPTLPYTRLRDLVGRVPKPALPGMSAEDVLAAMHTDKKRGRQGLRFILLDAVGHAYVADDVQPDEVRAALAVVGVH